MRVGQRIFFCKNIREHFAIKRKITTFAVSQKIKQQPMKKGFILRIDFVEKFGFSCTTLVLVSLLVDALNKGDGWLTMQQDEIAKMLGISSARVNQIFRILKRDGFLMQKKASERKYKNRKAYKFNEEKLK